MATALAGFGAVGAGVAIWMADDGATVDQFVATRSVDPGEAVSVDIPEEFVLVNDPDLPVTFRLPPTWTWASLLGGVEGVGTALVPRSPEIAADLDDRLASLPRSSLVVAFDRDDLDLTGFSTNVVVLRLPSGLPLEPDATREAIVGQANRAIFDVEEVSYIAGSDGPVLRVHYRAPALGPSAEGLQYWMVDGGRVYTLNVQSDQLPDYTATADAMAASFDSAG